EVLAKGYTQVEDSLKNILTDFATKTRENMSVSKVQVINVPDGAASGIYVHSNFKQAAVAIVKGSADDKVKEFARDCCMHLVAFTPAYIKQSDVPASYIDEQKEIFKVQMANDEKMAGKPDAAKEKILEGKIKKHLSEVCFVDQMFVKDDKKTVEAKLAEVGNSVGAKLEFGEIALLQLGK
ncbi:MAG: translation elongation factor Ts, partial [Treponema sp.]|nr:translation elongation factor Ts [Treponema sp.]